MLKFLFPLWVSAVVIGSYAAWRDFRVSSMLGAVAATGCLFIWHRAHRAVREATSDPVEMPTFVPRTPAQRQAEAMRIATTPVDDEGEMLPPTPNMGEFGEPYLGPRYF